MQPEKVISTLAVGENFDSDLFQVAISFAENGLYVWLISPQAFDKAPKNVKTPDKEVLRLITFLYLKDHTDLLTQINGIHLWRKVPNVIIITGFEHYCSFSTPDYNPLQAALITTSLLDSAAVCATRNNDKVFLLVCCGTTASGERKKPLQVIKDLYFSCYLEKREKTNEFCKNVTSLFK
ncbi:uncharacterized protein LOC123015202 [Tribolium madens]|uniref:uncharacterized protein LOC123015202 n=1 Tax=Tribolium madens TaxID=41895 RepID=UPI001CF75AC7|nr:uncharacterized protein LOC123015202 [Tribolium madens]